MSSRILDGPSDLSLWAALDLIPGLGGESFRRLLGGIGEPEAIFGANVDTLSNFVKPVVAQAISKGPDTQSRGRVLQWLARPGNHIVTLADADYPRMLLEISDPPPLLYVKGRRELLGSSSLAIVGSRTPSPQGLSNAQSFAHHLSDSGLTIVSGMALGIDGAAHRGGLKGLSSSIAVVGTGLDIIYPARHRDLAHQLAEEGALVSEFPLGTPSKAQNFPRRNRIISGLSQGCLVVEAALQSGSLITARLAAEQGREVFAIPGSIHSPLSKGCHYLIKQGAKLVDSSADILEELGLSPAKDSTGQSPPQTVTKEEQRLLACLGYDPCTMNSLVDRSGLTADTVCAILLNMELKGLIAVLPGGSYQRI